MPVRFNIVFDEKTNEYLFNLLSNISKEKKGQLNTKELKYFKTKSSLKRFITNSIIDKKLTLFTRLGYDWSLLFFDSSKFTIAEIKNAYKQHSMEGLRVENIDQMIRDHTFVLGAKEIAIGLAMMSSNCHTDIWRINNQFLKFSRDVSNVREMMKNSEKNQNVEFLSTYQSMRKLNRLLFHLGGMDAYVEAVLGLQMTDIGILNVLYEKPHSYYREDVIQKKLSHIYRPTTIATRCRTLFDWGYLEKIPTAVKKPSFQIKAKGVLALGEIFNRFVNQMEEEL